MINHFKAEFYKLRHSKILITILGVCAAVIMVSFCLLYTSPSPRD